MQLPAQAQVFHFPAFQSQPLQVPSWQNPSTGEGDILIDNFEYWDSPYNHGWMQQEPAYPVYGFGMGYATIFNTVLDLQEGSRVLDVYRPASIFLIGTPFEKHMITKFLFAPPTAASPSGTSGINLDPNTDGQSNAILSFKFRAPLGIEPWDIFELQVHGTTLGTDGIGGNDDDGAFIIQVRPIQPPAGSGIRNLDISTATTGYYLSELVQPGSGTSPMIIRVDIGRNFLDGSWHVVWLDLNEINRRANQGSVPSGWEFANATRIMVGGQMFRLDDIIFRVSDFTRLEPPDLFEVCPLYAQIFEPYRYLFVADYEASGEIKNVNNLLLDATNFIMDPNQIRNAWVSDLLRLDPNYHVIDPNHSGYDPNYTQRWLPGDPNYGRPDTMAGNYLREDFFIDSTLPVFTDPELRIGGDRSSELRNHGTLTWNMTVGGYGASAIQAFLIRPLPINPYDGMPTYLLTKYKAIEAIKAYGQYYFGPLQCLTLESALWNAGVILWPHIAYVDYTPQYFEDLILVLEVSNGFLSDTRVFPMSVVNFPMENYPPVTQMNICARFFIVGQENECLILFQDPDCFIYSMAQYQGGVPATSHLPMLPGNQIRTDQERLVHQMTMNGLNTYQYGPWINSIIDPHSGLTSFTPQFEGVLHTVVTCTDDRGAMDFGERPIYCVYPGTWQNHPPIVIASPARPQVVRAGEELIITDIIIQDPDGDELYASSNIGSMGKMANGSYMWTFQSNFPGYYHVEVLFYDIRGGYTIMRIELEVKPWWSY